MKKTILLLIGVITCFAACDSFLDTNPRTQVSEEEFFKTEEEVMMGLYAMMNEVQNGLTEVFSYASLLSDESETGGGIGEGVYKYKYDNFTYDPTTSPPWWNEWSYGIYNGVTWSNILISKINQSGLSDNFVRALDAEVRFYRALYYCYLFKGYELFPLIKEPLAVSEIYTVGKGTRQEIFEFMLSDLDDNVTQYLPARANTEHGRICRDAAKILRTKIIMFHRDESYYPLALNDMKEIINSGRYSLIPDYRKIFLKEGEWGAESIYEIAYAGDNSSEGNGMSQSMSGRSINDPRSAEQGGLGDGWGQQTMPSTIYNMFKPGDTRREGTVIDYREEVKHVQELVRKGDLAPGDTFVVGSQESFEWYGHYKHHARKENMSPVNYRSNYSNPFRFYRYADALLLATELHARINGSINAEAQGWFNQIRDRAFQNEDNRIDLTTKNIDEILDIIFDERAYEFTDEMQRWFTIMRFDKGLEILAHKGWTEKNRYFPIAQKEIDKSRGNLTQNPGWQ